MNKAPAALFALFASITSSAVAHAQTTRFTTPTGGDASGNYLMVESTAHEGSLHGDRVIEQLEVHGGYTTGSLTQFVVSGSEPVALRTLRVHLPYGLSLDLARNDHVHIELHSQRRGLGSVHELTVTRGGDLVLLSTASDHAAGFTIARGAETSTSGSRHTYEVRITHGAETVAVGPHDLAYLTPHLLAGGVDTAFVGTRPPDGFDQRLVTIVRVRTTSSSAH